MKQKKRKCSARNRKRNKIVVVALSLLMTLTFIAGGTIAYLSISGGRVTNTFQAGQVDCEVNYNNQNFESITNKGNVSAYIRVAVTVNWVEDWLSDRDTYAIAPEYTITANESGGWEERDGYFYYVNPVPAKENNVISAVPATVTVTSENPNDNVYELEIRYLAEAIQAEGVKDGTNTPAYQNAWYGTE